MDYANVVRQLADAIIDLGLSEKLTVYDSPEGEVTPGRYLPQVQQLLGELAWCVSHGANVKFYQDGTVNLYFYPNEDADEPIEAHGSTLEEAIKEAEEKEGGRDE